MTKSSPYKVKQMGHNAPNPQNNMITKMNKRFIKGKSKRYGDKCWMRKSNRPPPRKHIVTRPIILK
jgi:hypothetical protein